MALVLVNEPMPANPSMGCGQTWPVGTRIYNIPPQEFECSSKVITSGPSGLPNKDLIHEHYEHEDDCISMVRQFVVPVMPVNIAVKLENLGNLKKTVLKDLGPYFNNISTWSAAHGAGALRACPNPLLLV